MNQTKAERIHQLEQTLWRVVKTVHGHKKSTGTLSEAVDRIVQPVLFPIKENGDPAPGATRRTS